MQRKSNLVCAIAIGLVASCQPDGDTSHATADTQTAVYAARVSGLEPDPDPQPELPQPELPQPELPQPELPQPELPQPQPDPGPQTAPEAPPGGWIEVANAGAVRLLIGARDSAATPLLIKLQDAEPSERYQIFIDADGDASTGIQPGYWKATGADYLIESGTLYTTSEVGGWTDSAIPGKPLMPKKDGSDLVLEIPASDLPGLSESLQLGLGFIKLPPASSGSDTPVLVLPQDKLWRTGPTWPGGGMIVPAYTPASAGDWLELATQAGVVAKSTSSRKDFWVVMNGNSGPYITAEDITAANTNAQNIHDKQGKVFGYVHACDSKIQPDGTFKCLELLPYTNVLKQINQWLTDVPTLDGIWVDEFYPHLEVGSQKQGSQFLPNGGAFEQITSHIRGLVNGAGSSLVIIGNAGSPLSSDRLKYAALVDVLCSFESTGDEIKHGAERQAVRPRYGQLALVHTVTDKTLLPGILKTVFDAGYSHVFVGDGNIPSKTAWLKNPPYLAQEVSLVSPP